MAKVVDEHRVHLWLTPEQAKQLERLAVVNFGFKRENPRKGWTPREYRQSRTFAVQCIVDEALKDK